MTVKSKEGPRVAARRQRELEGRYGDKAHLVALKRCPDCGEEFEHDAGDQPERCGRCETGLNAGSLDGSRRRLDPNTSQAQGDPSGWRDLLPRGLVVERRLPEEWGITIDPEFRDALRKLTEDEHRRLEADIIERGCIDPLIVWKQWDGMVNGGKAPVRTLIDGHNRYQLCTQHRKPVAIVELEFGSRAEALAWIEAHQAGRRNLDDAALAAMYERELAARRNGNGKPGGKAAEVVAKATGKSAATVKRAAKAERERAAVRANAAVRRANVKSMADAQVTSQQMADLVTAGADYLAVEPLSRGDISTLAKLPKAEIKRAAKRGATGLRELAEQSRRAQTPRRNYQELVDEFRRLADRQIDLLRDDETEDAIQAWLEVGRQKLVEHGEARPKRRGKMQGNHKGAKTRRKPR